MTKVAILGAGPTGLMAAHAAAELGFQPTIYSIIQKSRLYGAQYLHREIPGIPLPDPRPLRVLLRGDAAGYRDKVYGKGYTGPVSAGAIEDGSLAWDLRAAYDWLYAKYVAEGDFIECVVTLDSMPQIVAHFDKNYDFTFSSLPSRVLCRPLDPNVTHDWKGQDIYAIGDAPDMGLMCPVGCPDETIQYDGTKDTGWYRSARIYGHTTCEWPMMVRRPPLANISKVIKPISTNCDCWPQLVRIGRYGKWQKGVLTHHAFEDVTRILTGAGVQGALF